MNKLGVLAKSKFRSSFHLNNKMKDYVKDKGINVIRTHAYDFANSRQLQHVVVGV